MTIISYFPAKQHAGALQVLREDTHKQKGMLTYWGSHGMIIFHEQSIMNKATEDRKNY